MTAGAGGVLFIVPAAGSVNLSFLVADPYGAIMREMSLIRMLPTLLHILYAMTITPFKFRDLPSEMRG